MAVDPDRLSWLINSMEELEESWEQERNMHPEMGNMMFSTLAMYKPYEPSTFWKEIKVGTIKKLIDIEVEQQLKLMLKSFFLKKYPFQTIECSAHLASQLRDPNDTTQLIIDPALFDENQIKQEVVGNIDHNIPDTDILVGKGLYLYNQLTNEKHMKSSHIWGPALAAILMTADARSPASVFYKLRNLETSLTNSYPDDNVTFPPITDRRTWLEFIEPLKKPMQYHYTTQRNTVKLGFIVSYHKENATPQARDILDFLLLQTLRYTGMALISLPLEICKYFECTPADLQKLTCFSRILCKDWETFDKVMKKYEKDPYWPYAKEFSNCVFPAVAYAKCYQLCQILALIKDYISGANQNPKIGSVYNQMQANRTKIPPAPQEYKITAEKAYLKLRQKFKEAA